MSNHIAPSISSVTFIFLDFSRSGVSKTKFVSKTYSNDVTKTESGTQRLDFAKEFFYFS